MKKIVLILVLVASTTVVSQNKDSEFWNNVRFGGGFGFGFGSNSTTLSISPSAVYDFNDLFSIGLSAGYLYNKNNGVKSNVFNFGVLSMLRPIDYIEFSAELQQLYVSQSLGPLKENYNYPALYLGVAYKSGIVSFGVRYDVLYDDNKSIYANAFSPFVRVFF